MKSEISQHPTETLLRMISEGGRDRDFIYEAQQCLFKRWRDDVDIMPLIDLIQSENSRDRMRGAYFASEAGPKSLRFAKAIMVLAADDLGYCRMIFVQHITNTGLYDEAIAAALATAMVDDCLSVRKHVINWAIYTTDDRFDDFSRLVDAGTGVTNSEFWREAQLKRSLRALGIARRVRAGESVAAIRKDTPEEDSYMFDYLQFFERRLQGYAERRREAGSALGSKASDRFDEYEIGVLGERYDNLGKLKGELPRFGS